MDPENKLENMLHMREPSQFLSHVKFFKGCPESYQPLKKKKFTFSILLIKHLPLAFKSQKPDPPPYINRIFLSEAGLKQKNKRPRDR